MSELEIKKEKDQDGDWVFKIYVGDDLVFEWHDCANIYYPEDLTWNRDIHEVFHAGVRAGKLIAQKKSKLNKGG